MSVRGKDFGQSRSVSAVDQHLVHRDGICIMHHTKLCLEQAAVRTLSRSVMIFFGFRHFHLIIGIFSV